MYQNWFFLLVLSYMFWLAKNLHFYKVLAFSMNMYLKCSKNKTKKNMLVNFREVRTYINYRYENLNSQDILKRNVPQLTIKETAYIIYHTIVSLLRIFTWKNPMHKTLFQMKQIAPKLVVQLQRHSKYSPKTPVANVSQ